MGEDVCARGWVSLSGGRGGAGGERRRQEYTKMKETHFERISSVKYVSILHRLSGL